jgi:hypothetical protein
MVYKAIYWGSPSLDIYNQLFHAIVQEHDYNLYFTVSIVLVLSRSSPRTCCTHLLDTALNLPVSPLKGRVQEWPCPRGES